MMSTPAIAALVVVFLIDRPANIPRALGLWPLKPAGRLLAYLGLALVVPIAVCMIALPIGAALGVFPADVTNFSAFRELLATSGQEGLPLPIETLVALQLINVVVAAFLNLIPSLGEEIGWRGWLLPKLMGRGAIPAIAASGLIWGSWHAPLILLGYNYPGAPAWLGLLMMIGMCTLIGAVFGWLRLRSNSVWPAALAHGSFNAAATTYVLFADAREQVNTVHATILGWSGWLVPVVLVAVLVVTGQFRARPVETDDPIASHPVAPHYEADGTAAQQVPQQSADPHPHRRTNSRAPYSP